jgi:hypothetical protein
MPNKNLWNNNVPRVEYDLRSRDARLRLERAERLLVKRDAAAAAVTQAAQLAYQQRRRQRPKAPTHRVAE